MNSGNTKYEEKLKLITLAYTQLKNTYREKIDSDLNIQPDIKVSIKQSFGIDTKMEVDAFSKKVNMFLKLIRIINLIRYNTAIISGLHSIKEFCSRLSWNRKINSHRTNRSKIKLAVHKS